MSGKMFKGLNSSTIPKEWAHQNKVMVCLKLGVLVSDICCAQNCFDPTVVGNYNKDFMGDLDIAFDENVFWGYIQGSEKDPWINLQKHLDQLKELNVIKDYGLVKGWHQFSILLPLIDNNYTNSKWGYDNKGCNFIENPLIQVDCHIGNVPWMQQVLGPASKDSKWKALYRTNLLADAINLIQYVVDEEKKIYSKYTMDYKKGIYKTTFQIVPPTGRQKLDQEVLLSKELLTSDPNEIHKILFTGKIPHSFVLSMNSYEEVYRMMKSDNFKFKELLPQIFHKFYTRLTKEKLEVPEEIIKELQLDLFIEV
jgi:hypothetical protein